jgi:hypothetical protein
VNPKYSGQLRNDVYISSSHSFIEPNRPAGQDGDETKKDFAGEAKATAGQYVGIQLSKPRTMLAMTCRIFPTIIFVF